MKETQIIVEIKEYDSVKELSIWESKLLSQASAALNYSYSPYSNFSVGAAALLSNGELVLGSNQENASFPAGICAERSAIYNAVHQFKDEAIQAMAITVSSEEFEVTSPIAPCGICRQVLLETELQQGSDIHIILRGSKGRIYTLPNANSLLPIYFFEKGLKKDN